MSGPRLEASLLPHSTGTAWCWPGCDVSTTAFLNLRFFTGELAVTMLLRDPALVALERPFAGHFLTFRPKLHRGSTRDVALTEFGLLRTAKRERVARNGNPHVHPNHTRRRLFRHSACHCTAPSENARCVAVGTLLFECECRVESVDLDDAQHWAEQFPRGALHLGPHAVQNRRPKPITSRVPLRRSQTPPVDAHAGALCFGAVDRCHESLARVGVDQCAHVLTQSAAPRQLDDTLDDLAGSTDSDQDAARHAALPRTARERVVDGAHRELGIS